MIYVSGDTEINFYTDAIKGRTQAEFVKAHKHQDLTEAQLKEVYELLKEEKKHLPKEDNNSSFSSEQGVS